MDDLNIFKNNYFKAEINVGGTIIEDTQSVKCLFHGITNELINLIDNSKKGDFILFCVAWFTNLDILKKLKLAKNKGVRILIVILKEPWLIKNTKLMTKYSNLNNMDDLEKKDYLKIFKEYGNEFCLKKIVDWNSLNFEEDTVRVCGKIQTNPSEYISRMHNKFIVFGSFENGKIEPKTVWTGSFNISIAAGKSFENVIILNSTEAASQYLKQFCLIFFLSEPLETKNLIMSPNVTYDTFKAKENVLVRTSSLLEDEVEEDKKVFWFMSEIIKTDTSTGSATVKFPIGFKEKIPFCNIQSSKLKLVKLFKDFQKGLLYIIKNKDKNSYKSGKLIEKTKKDNEIILNFELVHEKNKIIEKKFNGKIKNIFLSNEVY
ncbi:hypothetical protein ACTFIT_011553 [Dictyostelium discoideum]